MVLLLVSYKWPQFGYYSAESAVSIEMVGQIAAIFPDDHMSLWQLILFISPSLSMTNL